MKLWKKIALGVGVFVAFAAATAHQGGTQSVNTNQVVQPTKTVQTQSAPQAVSETPAQVQPQVSESKTTPETAPKEKSIPVKTYTNSQGNEVQSPTYYNSQPEGATAKCGDGTYSFSQSRRGTCSRHGGVANWL